MKRCDKCRLPIDEGEDHYYTGVECLFKVELPGDYTFRIERIAEIEHYDCPL